MSTVLHLTFECLYAETKKEGPRHARSARLRERDRDSKKKGRRSMPSPRSVYNKCNETRLNTRLKGVCWKVGVKGMDYAGDVTRVGRACHHHKRTTYCVFLFDNLLSCA